jgi:hypothetical protein
MAVDNDADILAGLDFVASPQQCECADCMSNPDGPCGNDAMWCTRVHAFGQCDARPYAEAGGYAVQFVCHLCMAARAARVAYLFDQSHLASRMVGNYLCCVPCGRELIRVTDFWESRVI